MNTIIENIDRLRDILNTLQSFTPEWNSVRKQINDLENKLSDIGGSYPISTKPITNVPSKPCCCTVKKVNTVFILTAIVVLLAASKE